MRRYLAICATFGRFNGQPPGEPLRVTGAPMKPDPNPEQSCLRQILPSKLG